MKTRNKMKKLEQEKFVIPKTVQNVIPIKAVYKDGIFLVGKNMYSKTFLFTDVNYYIACENEKNDLMRQYWAVINSFGNGVTVKLTINNHRFDKEDFEKFALAWIKSEVLIPKRLVFKAESKTHIENKEMIIQNEKEVFKNNENSQ